MPIRKSALEVSGFANEPEEEEEQLLPGRRRLAESSKAESSTRGNNAKRRKTHSSPEARHPKRHLSQKDPSGHKHNLISNKENNVSNPARSYVPKAGLKECPEEEAHHYLGHEVDSGTVADDKPIMLLTDFSIFDPKHGDELINLSLLEKGDPSLDRAFEGVGDARDYLLDDEDAGQEDDLGDTETTRIRLGAIFHYSVDYTKEDDPVWIETTFGWYILESPSRQYEHVFKQFLEPIRIAQIVISTAMAPDAPTFDEFMASIPTHTLFGRALKRADIWAVVPVIRDALERTDDEDELSKLPIIARLLGTRSSSSSVRHVHRQRPQPSHPRLQHRKFAGDVDVAVLKSENQTPTHVTPLIASLAHGLFREKLYVVGPPLKPPPALSEEAQKAIRLRLLRLLGKAARSKHPTVNMSSSNRLKPNSNYWTQVTIDDVKYQIGDCILSPKGKFDRRRAPALPTDAGSVPDDATIPDYFWFAKIISIKRDLVHVQWYEHASETLMGEVSDPQELFLTKICGDVAYQFVVGRAKVYDLTSGPQPSARDPDGFYTKFMYDSNTAVIESMDHQASLAIESHPPPDNCSVCLLQEQRNLDEVPSILPSGKGVTWHGGCYHVHDFILLKADKGPCQVGQIRSIDVPNRKPATITVRLLGRISQMERRPDNVDKDERHLFLTDDQLECGLEYIIRSCSVVHPDATDDLDAWLSHSPLNFYCRYRFSSIEPDSWNQKQRLTCGDISQCPTCAPEMTQSYRKFQKFESATRPLRAFDPFGGIGAFGLGLEQSGCIRVTHSVEISPSASETMQLNSPGTVVYNQCANKVLQYAIKSQEKHDIEVPLSLRDETPLPKPPRPKDVDCIIAGFPCQPHSRLNMYQKANDVKSNLILNVLSWVDYLKPKFCIFENVRGFLRFNLNATQADIYRTEGGIDMGGLKFVVRVLVAMNYQVRFGLLQAAHYGTPQTRVRFFMIAAIEGQPLPQLPQPTHDFPVVDALRIELTNGDSIEPIRTMSGTAPHTFVSVEDAIGDLPRFDWKNPAGGPARTQEEVRRYGSVRSVSCNNTLSTCGLPESAEYHHKPITTFQKRSRSTEVQNLQHFTRTYRKEKVERVVNVPLDSKADYRSFRPDLFEWQTSNPASAVARLGFRPGMYSRLDQNTWFSTTVTNVDPVAKQCRVMNPYCKRTVTVRELARSQGLPDNFEFVSLTGSIVTMHRQIGNAIPIPLGAALGYEVKKALFNKWCAEEAKKNDEIIVLDDDDD